MESCLRSSLFFINSIKKNTIDSTSVNRVKTASAKNNPIKKPLLRPRYSFRAIKIKGTPKASTWYAEIFMTDTLNKTVENTKKRESQSESIFPNLNLLEIKYTREKDDNIEKMPIKYCGMFLPKTAINGMRKIDENGPKYK